MILQVAADPSRGIQRPRADERLAGFTASSDDFVKQLQRPRVVAVAATCQSGFPFCPEEHEQLIARENGWLPVFQQRQGMVVAAAPVEDLATGDRPPGPA